MIVINNVDSQKFTFNGVEYFKNFTPVVVGNKIRVLNTYDSSIELTDAPRLYSDFEVDGVVYASVSLLQTALLPILYTRNSLIGDFLSSDITDYTPATTPLSGTEKALIHDGTDFKEVEVSEFGGGDFIPLSGTTVGNPVTGDIEIEDYRKIYFPSIEAGFTSEIFSDGGSLTITSYGVNFQFSGDGINVGNTDNPYDFVGFSGNEDYSEIAPTNKLIYAQRQYVDNALSSSVSGTTNRIAKFTASGVVGDSILREVSTNAKGIALQNASPTNTTFGFNTLSSASLSGTSNTAFGHNILSALTTGANNSAFGYDVLKSITNGNNNTGFGFNCLSSLSTGSENNSFGYLCFNNLTSGSGNTVFGVGAGRFIADGVTGLTTSNQSVFLGNLTKSLANNSLNEIVIGYNAIGNGNNSVTIGNDSITKTLLKGIVGIGTTSPNASSILDLTSTTKGFLPPRMTAVQKTAITSPTAGLIVYDTTDNKHYGYNGTTWNALY